MTCGLADLSPSPPAMRVIANADDLGLYPHIDSAIFQLMSAGLVSSATVVANGPTVESAVREHFHFPQCSFGVHLNITVFKPLAPSKHLNPLLNEQGYFVNNVRETILTPELLYGIYKEFSAQIERLMSLSVDISHIDSHHHIHTIPAIFPVLKLVQRRYGIRKVRISQNIYTSRDIPSKRLLLQKRLFNYMLRKCYTTVTTAGFTDLMTFIQAAKFSCFSFETVEVILHPGTSTYQKEAKLCYSSWPEQVPFRVELISFREL